MMPLSKLSARFFSSFVVQNRPVRDRRAACHSTVWPAPVRARERDPDRPGTAANVRRGVGPLRPRMTLLSVRFRPFEIRREERPGQHDARMAYADVVQIWSSAFVPYGMPGGRTEGLAGTGDFFCGMVGVGIGVSLIAQVQQQFAF